MAAFRALNAAFRRALREPPLPVCSLPQGLR